MRQLTKVTGAQGSGKSPRFLAYELAIASGFNCYSKPSLPEYADRRAESEEIFYFSWKGLILEVTIILETVNQQPAETNGY